MHKYISNYLAIISILYSVDLNSQSVKIVEDSLVLSGVVFPKMKKVGVDTNYYFSKFKKVLGGEYKLQRVGRTSQIDIKYKKLGIILETSSIISKKRHDSIIISNFRFDITCVKEFSIFDQKIVENMTSKEIFNNPVLNSLIAFRDSDNTTSMLLELVDWGIVLTFNSTTQKLETVHVSF